jgi:hypothetical protein
VYTYGPSLQGSAEKAFIYNKQAFSYYLHAFNSFFTAEMDAVYTVFSSFAANIGVTILSVQLL